jgi:hypothetical protein
VYPGVAVPFDSATGESGRLRAAPHPEWTGHPTYNRDAARLQPSPTGRFDCLVLPLAHLTLQVGTHSRDEPMKDAMSWQVPVEKEDIVVLGSDGLMDNLVS